MGEGRSRSAETPLPDARRANWVDAHAPERLKPWLKLGRFDRPIGIWLLMLPGWQGLALAMVERDGPADWGAFVWRLSLFALGAALMRAAGCAYNDIVDRDIDARVARTADRPLASGRLRLREAWLFVGLACAASLAILLSFNRFAMGVGVASLVLVAAYPFMKRITWWPQAWLGLTFNWGALLGYAAAQGRLSPAALLLYASGVFWTLGYDTIYALQDIEDDALVGVKSSARRLGGRAQLGVGLAYGVSVLLALAIPPLATPGVAFLPLTGLFALHLAVQVRRLRLDDTALALRLFKSNRGAGVLLFAALLAGAIG